MGISCGLDMKEMVICVSKETNEHRYVRNLNVLKRRLRLFYPNVEHALELLMQGKTVTTSFCLYRLDGDWRQVACTEEVKK